MDFLQHLINGVYIGSIYAIIALGYTMVYGIAKMLNFAHGDVIMVGAFMSYTVTSSMNLSVIPSILIAMVICTLLGIIIEGLAYKPLRGTSNLAVLITAIGVSYFLQNAAQLIWGPAEIGFKRIVNVPPIVLFDGHLRISAEVLVTLAVAVLIMVGLTLFVNKTQTGKAMRAVSEDRDAAQLMGINVNRTISITFAIGSALAAVAGVLLCSKVQSVWPTVGSMPGIRAFTAAVFGGIGSIPGAMLGGMVLGLIETMTGAYISTQFSDAIVFLVLIIVLLVKPAGLLGKTVQEKV
jgi:branched-chain amino acid transport system permease protein